MSWEEMNQRALMAEVQAIRDLFDGDETTTTPLPVDAGQPTAADRIQHCFGLSQFERSLLVLCAAVELDSSFLLAIGGQPTFSLALGTLPGAHWSAITPDAPLRYWKLIEPATGHPLTTAPLRISERLLHALTGLDTIEPALAGLIDLRRPSTDLVPSHQEILDRVCVLLERRQPGAAPVVQLVGTDAGEQLEIAAHAASRVGGPLLQVRPAALPAQSTELEATLRLIARELILTGGLLAVDCHDSNEHSPAINRLFQQIPAGLVVVSRDPVRVTARPAVTIDVERPTGIERKWLWEQVLGPSAGHLNGRLDAIVDQFRISPEAIRSAGVDVLSRSAGSSTLDDLVWDAGRIQSRPQLDDLARRIEANAGWDDLVLPEPQLALLREIALHVRHYRTVYDEWGFAGKGSRGTGISALFSGASGTGKTTAAEILANELRLDLYRIDLSSVVSKYIGETEKNLRRIFDAAESGGAILLFDEADALFGRRSDVKDSHDRYANIEVSYLLQRIESYRGLAILTTNMRSALDPAFLRRIRFIVTFPFPDAGQRAEIWRRIFPPETPVAGLDIQRLAQLNIAGGNIRNIALNAAFLAASERQAVSMSHILRAAQSEYQKTERTLTASETEGWTDHARRT